MDTKPFTREQAEKIAAGFQHLVEQPLIISGVELTIHYVCVAPFNKILQKQFSYSCAGGIKQNPNEVLKQYPTTEFDVIIIAQILHANTYVKTIDIREYIKENNISYNLP